MSFLEPASSRESSHPLPWSFRSLLNEGRDAKQAELRSSFDDAFYLPGLLCKKQAWPEQKALVNPGMLPWLRTTAPCFSSCRRTVCFGQLDGYP